MRTADPQNFSLTLTSVSKEMNAKQMRIEPQNKSHYTSHSNVHVWNPPATHPTALWSFLSTEVHDELTTVVRRKTKRGSRNIFLHNTTGCCSWAPHTMDRSFFGPGKKRSCSQVCLGRFCTRNSIRDFRLYSANRKLRKENPDNSCGHLSGPIYKFQKCGFLFAQVQNANRRTSRLGKWGGRETFRP